MTKETDERGYYVLAKHVVVEFVLEEILDLSLSGFSHQNVLSSEWLAQKPLGRSGCNSLILRDRNSRISAAQNQMESVEKVGFPEEQGKLGDGKCLGEARRSFVGLPGAIQFLRISSD
jgi:hypothetical protein